MAGGGVAYWANSVRFAINPTEGRIIFEFEDTDGDIHQFFASTVEVETAELRRRYEALHKALGDVLRHETLS